MNNALDLQIQNRVGVVITTHGYNGVYIRQCIECYYNIFQNNIYIVVFINESNDPITLSLKNQFPNIDFIRISNQTLFGGLTATWNAGIDLCFKKNKDIIILSNDDILFGYSIKNIIYETYNSILRKQLVYFGPITNNPGPTKNNKIQYGEEPINKSPFLCKNNNSFINLNGFFMVFSKACLIKNKFNTQFYFDPRLPFGGNETEWFNRFMSIGGKPVIVPRTFIYHYKNKTWRKSYKLKSTCLYTINTGNYEGNTINVKPIDNIDTLYFTDNMSLIPICIKKNIIPFYITSKANPKLIQRTIKTQPHNYLPYHYDQSIYIDGNVIITNISILKQYLSLLNTYDLICFKHPDRIKVLDELYAIEKLQLESKTNVNSIKKILKEARFKDNVGLTETNILFRKHKSIIDFNNEWSKLITICIRDQATFDFLLLKHNVKFNHLTFKDKLACITKHKHINPKERFIK